MITSTSNNRIKNIIKLSTSSRARREQNVFVAEGVKMFIEAPFERIREVYISEDFETRLKDEGGDELLSGCMAKLEKTGYETVSTSVFKKMADTMTPQGIICLVKRRDIELSGLIGEKTDRLKVLVLESIQDPGNLGTMIRTAEGAGYDFILADEGTVDVYNPKVIRSTMGSIYRVPVIYTDLLTEGINTLKAAGVKVFAAHLKGKNNYDEADYGSRTAVMIGNEGKGLSDAAASMADEYIKIPMQGQVESLNAAVAAALIMFRSS